MAAKFEIRSGSLQLQRHLQNVEALVRSNEIPRAMQAAGVAVAQGFEHPNLLTLAAYDKLNHGVSEEALSLALRARELAPRSPDALNVLGLALARLNRFREAVPVYDAALRQSPGAAHLHFNRACALEELGEIKRARIALERVLDLQSNHAEALARLASMAAQRGDASAARDYAQRSLKLDPKGTAAPLALALADIEEKKFSQALMSLQPLAHASNPSVTNRAIALGLIGDSYDGLSAEENAFAAYSASKLLLHQLYRPVYEAANIETAAQRISRLISYFSTSKENWRRKTVQKASRVKTHVFLVGFPRSGTTLLERVLDCHPDMEAMQERDCLLDAANDFIIPAAGLDQLLSLDETAIQKYSELYWKRAAEFGKAPLKSVFVDKMPLNAVLLCLVAKLFPDAKILFALRDPRDCVFSCFRRRFGMTAQMYQLLTLNGATRYYHAVMTLSELYRQKLGLETHYLRYEDMVGNFDGEMRKVCAFLDVDWNDAMQDFAKKTRTVDVNTPSAAQVARGLYGHGAGQWRRYREQLTPVMPILAPWIAHFGYSQD